MDISVSFARWQQSEQAVTQVGVVFLVSLDRHLISLILTTMIDKMSCVF